MEQHPITKVIRTRTDRTDEMEHSSPLFLTSSFCFDNSEEMRAAFADETDDNIYSRFSNPNVKELVDRVCLLEGAEAGYATASGMSAVFASFMALMKQGDHLLSCSSIFGSTHTVITKFLPKYGIEYSYVPANKPEEWEAAIRPNTKMIYLETPTNPGLDIIDLEFVSALAKKHKLILNVDNCFATPISQRPIDFGADLFATLGNKMDGWPGPGSWRCDRWQKRIDTRYLFVLQKHWSCVISIQCMGIEQKPGNIGSKNGTPCSKCIKNSRSTKRSCKDIVRQVSFFAKSSPI